MKIMLNITFFSPFGDVTYCSDLRNKNLNWIENTPRGIFDASDFDVVDEYFNKVVKKVLKKLKKVSWHDAAWNISVNDNIPLLDMIVYDLRVVSYITIEIDSFDKVKIKYDN